MIDNPSFSDKDLHFILESVVPVGVCITDAKGIFRYVNQKYCDIYGYRQEELLGKSFLTVVPKEYHKTLQSLHDDFIETGGPEIPQDWEVIRKNGTRIYIHATAAMLENEKSERFKVTTVKNITLEKAIAIRKERAEQVLFHDLRSPMAGIINMLQLIQNYPDTATQYIPYLQEAGQRVLTLLQRTIDLSQIESPDFNPELEEVDLDKLISSLKLTFTSALEVRNQKLQITKSEGLPKAILSQSNLLTGALENLLRNASEASRTGIPIDLHLSSDGDSLSIKITNQGNIPEPMRDTFFQPFINKEKGRTGLGAYSAKKSIEALDGNVYFNTGDGITDMFIELPLKKITGP